MTVTGSRKATVSLPSDTQILITREFDAPRELVWKAWTTPELVRRWWHANRGEMTVCEIDLRVGGTWRYAMNAEGFGEVGFHGEYREIRAVRAARLDGGLRGHPGRGRQRRARHAHAGRGRRSDAHDRPRRAPDEGGPRRAHQLRHGGRHAGRDGSPRGGRDLAGAEKREPPTGKAPLARGFSVAGL